MTGRTLNAMTGARARPRSSQELATGQLQKREFSSSLYVRNLSIKERLMKAAHLKTTYLMKNHLKITPKSKDIQVWIYL